MSSTAGIVQGAIGSELHAAPSNPLDKRFHELPDEVSGAANSTTILLLIINSFPISDCLCLD